MLQAFPTKSGTGIAIYGNYGDLHALYHTIQHALDTLSESSPPQKAQRQLLLNFAYEVRKAYSGQRLVEKLSFAGDDIEHILYGFYLVWTDALIFINTLRHQAGYVQTGRLHQAVLYLLEHMVEEALFDYDAEGAHQIRDFISGGINTQDEYAFLISQAVHLKFISEPPGKERFRRIPTLLQNHFSSWRKEYKELIASFHRSAEKQSCTVADLEFSDFPQIVW